MKSMFISYSREDASDLAEYLYNNLKGAGYIVCKDDHSFPLGSYVPEEISKNVMKNDNFIVLLSKFSVNSRWVKDEINTAKISDRHIIPILVEAVEIPESLRALNYLDMIDVASRWRALHKLVNHLQDGESIPRVFNMSGYADIAVSEVLVLGHCDFKYANLDSPLSISENSEKLAQLALPYIKEANAGIVPPGHSALASATLAYLLGSINQMPQLFWTKKNTEGKFGISSENHVLLQKIRERGVEYRHTLN